MRDSRYPQIGDRALVEAALLGEMAAFDELVRRFRGAVLLVTEQVLGAPDCAQDAAQEAFLLAFKALPSLQDPERFPAWLCAIARNRARRMALRNGRSAPIEPGQLDRLILAHSHELSADPADEMERREEQARLREALAEIPPEYRLVIHLYHYEDWPTARIADFLSLPRTTVKWRLYHGRKLLCRRLAAEERVDD